MDWRLVKMFELGSFIGGFCLCMCFWIDSLGKILGDRA